jgi:hypothetical protein
VSIVLYIKPTVPPLTWKEFCSTHPPFSVALDGYLNHGPSFDESGPRVNFDHHQGVNRLATRSTCGQVYLAIKQGLFARFRDENGARAEVYVNDCDEDVCSSWTLLKNGENKAFIESPALHDLVETIDLLDTTSGTYPFPKGHAMLEYIAWVFEEYRHFRMTGGVDKKDATAFAFIIDQVEKRLKLFSRGAGKRLALDMRYRILSRQAAWLMIEEIGTQARMGMAANNVTAFVSARQRPNREFWTYTVARSSLFVPFPLSDIFAALNAAENISTNDRWNGGDTVGGSPRVKGSTLNPQEVIKVINKTIKQKEVS